MVKGVRVRWGVTVSTGNVRVTSEGEPGFDNPNVSNIPNVLTDLSSVNLNARTEFTPDLPVESVKTRPEVAMTQRKEGGAIFWQSTFDLNTVETRQHYRSSWP